MSDNSEGMWTRWSRLKRAHTTKAAERRRGVAALAISSDNAPEEQASAPSESHLTEEKAADPVPVVPSDLPDASNLNKDSDFTPFLRPDVPEDLHRQALRALWRSDPIFSFRDGLTDSDEDYTSIGTVKQAVRTAYHVGKGYLDEETRAAWPEAQPADENDAATAAPESSAGALVEGSQTADPAPTAADTKGSGQSPEYPKKT